MIIPDWYAKLPLPALQASAAKYSVDPFLIAAIAQHESVGDPWKTRYEPGADKWVSASYPQFARACGISQATEKVNEMTSWGLCQIMGYVARSMGWQKHLTQFLDPGVNLEYGARLLKELETRFGDEPSVISAYNQGSPRRADDGTFENQPYVDEVTAFLKQLRGAVS